MDYYTDWQSSPEPKEKVVLTIYKDGEIVETVSLAIVVEEWMREKGYLQVEPLKS